MSEKPNGESKAPDAPPESIAFHFIKSADFRTIFVDGAFGGVSPRGNLNVAFYSERGPIPLRTVHEVKKDGTLGKVIAREGREGIIRDMVVNAVMSFETAERVANWMLEHVNKGRKLMSEKD